MVWAIPTAIVIAAALIIVWFFLFKRGSPKQGSAIGQYATIIIALLAFIVGFPVVAKLVTDNFAFYLFIIIGVIIAGKWFLR